MNPPRINFIKTHLNLPEKRILDIGCGGGLLSESLTRLGAKVTGVDAGFENIEIAKIHAKEQLLDIHYLSCDAESLVDGMKHSFDALCGLEVVEHVESRSVFLKACSDLVKVFVFKYSRAVNYSLVQ